MTQMHLLAITPIDRFLAIRDRFATGGSTEAFVFVLIGMMLFFLLLVLLAKVARHRQQRRVYNPRTLFLDALGAVPLTVPQRDLIRRVARELRLPHPTVLLLSPQVFHESANAWMSATGNANTATRQRLDDLAHAVFGESAQ